MGFFSPVVLVAVAGTITGHPITASVGPETKEFEFSYRATIRHIPAAAKTLQVWVPVPQADDRQSIWDLKVTSPLPYREVTDSEYGNLALYFEAAARLPDSIPLLMTFRTRRSEVWPLPENDTGRVVRDRIKRFLSPDALVPIDGKIAAEALRVVTGHSGVRAKARALYDHILATMRYDKTGTGWGKGDAVFACDERRGNCTDIHSLLIGMARATGIPARFVMGFPIPENAAAGEIKGYHCWADLYIDGAGWVPVDASEAIRNPGKSGYYFGHVDDRRVAFTIGRDISLTGGGAAPKINYFIYPYVLVDGQEFTDVVRKFEFRVVAESTAVNSSTAR
ncbi:MAG: transglutaminase domain-containing protein [candidate division Zixibacteria bacterium]|nr:transglutaminase domain-containing protein [candidate division Zixibacteria bacterium]